MKRVLLTPLDWGLGHATRCIPIIRELLQRNCQVLIAGSGDALALLQKEFPRLSFFTLPGYAPRYPLTGSMTLSMAWQLHRFMRVVSAEHREVARIIEKQSIDLIISDNRYGCWSSKIPSVFITHQSNVLMPRRFGMLQSAVRKLSERLINRFDHCWIPDFPEGHSLAGALISFGKIRVKSKVAFIGWLSRFEAPRPAAFELDILAILSGPEPQRTAFENILAPQLKASGLKFRLVRGLASAASDPEDPRFVNFEGSSALQSSIASAAVVIARSGYSTVMDMQAMGKKVIFVPTPGQTEQEYLAKRLMERGVAFSMSQKDLNLSHALSETNRYSGFTPSGANGLLREEVGKVLMS